MIAALDGSDRSLRRLGQQYDGTSGFESTLHGTRRMRKTCATERLFPISADSKVDRRGRRF